MVRSTDKTGPYPTGQAESPYNHTYSSEQVEEALSHADWWTLGGRQGEMLTTDAFRILAEEVRALRRDRENLLARWGGGAS
jgi:hypothetical protein